MKNNLKNFCQFLDTGAIDLIDEFGSTEARRLFNEHLFNLMVEADVDEQVAIRLSDELMKMTFDRDFAEED